MNAGTEPSCSVIQTQHTYEHKWLSHYNRVVLLSSFHNYIITRIFMYVIRLRIYVEGTTYNHGRPEGISEDQHPMNQFLGMLYGHVRP